MKDILTWLRATGPGTEGVTVPDLTAIVARQVITNLSVHVSPSTLLFSNCDPDRNPDRQRWHRIEKELYLHQDSQQKAWLYVEVATQEELAADDLVVTDIIVGELPPSPSSNSSWTSRNGGLSVQRRKFTGNIDHVVTAVDVLFGEDAVDPRPQWDLMQSPLQLRSRSNIPTARLTVLRGRAKPRPESQRELRVSKNGKIKIVQLSDMHMTTGVGVCSDAIDADGKNLLSSNADPLTVDFVGEILDTEKPNIVILSGDQLHHDILDSQTALFKVVAPMIDRSIPFAVIFGNHDSEGSHALTREEQMSIFESLPYCFSTSGSEDVDGVGNFCLHVLAPAPSQFPVSTLYFFDSHGQLPGILRSGYDYIKRDQIKWFQNCSQANRKVREQNKDDNRFHLPLAFLHIPLPEFAKDSHLHIQSGRRRESTEGPGVNSRLYDALAKECIAALGCGHDHGNDFAALLRQSQPNKGSTPYRGPWLCYSGAVGFGGYGSYGGERFHRRARVFDLATDAGRLTTWLRVQYEEAPVDELILLDRGDIADLPSERDECRRCIVS